MLYFIINCIAFDFWLDARIALSIELIMFLEWTFNCDRGAFCLRFGINLVPKYRVNQSWLLTTVVNWAHYILYNFDNVKLLLHASDCRHRRSLTPFSGLLFQGYYFHAKWGKNWTTQLKTFCYNTQDTGCSDNKVTLDRTRFQCQL